MRGHQSELEALDVSVTLIGSGNRAMAESFRTEQDIPFRILVDPKREAYQALSLRRSMISTFSPGATAAGIRAFRAGFRQGTMQGDAFQQGGVFVVRPGGEVAYSYRSRHAGDHPSFDEVLAALRAPAAAG